MFVFNDKILKNDSYFKIWNILHKIRWYLGGMIIFVRPRKANFWKKVVQNQNS